MHGFLDRMVSEEVPDLECDGGWAYVNLRTLTGAASDDAFPPLVLAETSHEVVRSSDFEAKDLLEILALEPYLVAEFCAKVGGTDEGSFFEDLVDFGV